MSTNRNKPNTIRFERVQVGNMEVFIEAGLPAGVINMISVDGPVAGDVIFSHPDFAGLQRRGLSFGLPSEHSCATLAKPRDHCRQ